MKNFKQIEYALLRYQHSLSAGELVNIGLVLWVPSSSSLFVEIPLRHNRLSKFISNFDGTGFRSLLKELRDRSKLKVTELKGIPDLFNTKPPDFADILFFYVPRDHNCLAWSDIMGGICKDPAERALQLRIEFLDRHEIRSHRERRDEKALETDLMRHFEQAGISNAVRPIELRGAVIKHDFKFGWMNGRQNVIEPISLDYQDAKDMTEKAQAQAGKLFDLNLEQRDLGIVLLVSDGGDDQPKHYKQACDLLSRAPLVRKVIQESELREFIQVIKKEIEHSNQSQAESPNSISNQGPTC